MSLLGSVASGAISALGGLGSSMISSAGGAAANAMSAKEAQKQRNWQEHMSNTAHQREVTDLRAAGLNPIMSSFGGGASTGNSSLPQIVNPYQGFNTGIESGVNSYNSARRIDDVEKENVKIQQALATSQILKNSKEAEYIGEQSKLSAVNRDVATAQIAKTIQETATSKAYAATTSASIRRDLEAAGLSSAQAKKVYEEIGDIERARLSPFTSAGLGSIVMGLGDSLGLESSKRHLSRIGK